METISLSALTEYLGNQFSLCDDYITRELDADGTKVFICFFRGGTERDYISEKIIRPILQNADKIAALNGAYEKILYSVSIKAPSSKEDIRDALMNGEVLVASESGGTLYAATVNAQMTVGRNIQEPTSDITVKGPRAGFVEDSEKNITELRRYIKSSDLKFESFKAGSVTNTKITLAYISGRAEKTVVDELRQKINGIDATGIVDSGNVEMLMETRKYSIFPTMGSSEKVDKIASKLLSGRAAVIVDGSPFVLTAPYVFAESLQSAEDYMRSPYYATFSRLLRFLALLVAVYMPALLVAAVTSHNELLPEVLLKTINEMRAELPFNILWEVFIVLIIFEMLREVGIRMPRTVGDAIGIVGSLILGDAAVKAGIASPIVIIAVAISAVCAFIVPVYMYSTVFLRFIFLFLGYYLGFFGIATGTVVLLFILCSIKSFGSPYLSPLVNADLKGLEDFLLAIPKKTLGRIEKP